MTSDLSSARNASAFLAQVFVDAIERHPRASVLKTLLTFEDGELRLSASTATGEDAAAVISAAHRIAATWSWLRDALTWSTLDLTDLAIGDAPNASTDFEGITIVQTPHPNQLMLKWVHWMVMNTLRYVDCYVAGALNLEELQERLTTIVLEAVGSAGEYNNSIIDPRKRTNEEFLTMWLDLYGIRIWRRLPRFPHARVAGWLGGVDVDGSSHEFVSGKDIRNAGKMLRHFVIARVQSTLDRIRVRFVDDPALVAKVDLLWNDLQATRRGLGAPNALKSEAQYVERLQELRVLLGGTPEERDIEELIAAAHSFGFAFVEMHPRINAASIRSLVQQLYPRVMPGESYPSSEDERVRAMRELIEASTPLPEDLNGLSTTSRWLLDIIQALGDVASRNGRVPHLILAEYESLADTLAAEWLAQTCKLEGVTITPLHETPSAAISAPDLFEAELAYRNEHGDAAWVPTRMFGWSDLARHLGLIPSQLRIRSSLLQTDQCAVEAGLRWNAYLGWGERTPHRGGASTFERQLARLPISSGRLIATTQGDDCWRWFATPRIFDRSFAPVTYASGQGDPIDHPQYEEVLTRLRDEGASNFAELTASEAFDHVYAGIRIPSRDVVKSVRPGQRAADGTGVSSDELRGQWSRGRAIGCLQTGIVGGYVFTTYGVGSVLDTLSSGAHLEELRQLASSSFFFGELLDMLWHEYLASDLEGLQMLAGAVDSRYTEEVLLALTEDRRRGILALERITGTASLPREQQATRNVKVVRRNVGSLWRDSGYQLPEDGPTREGILHGVQAILALSGLSG